MGVVADTIRELCAANSAQVFTFVGESRRSAQREQHRRGLARALTGRHDLAHRRVASKNRCASR